MSDKQPPPISEVLIEWLQSVFPDRCPDLDMSDREVWASVGEQTVIKRLRAEYKRQSETIRNVLR